MPSTFCLLPNLAEKFKTAIRNGEVDIEKLSSMSSAERRDFFKGYFGEERIAKETNALFESKLLLKNQKRGLVNWAKQVTGIKPEVKTDLASKIEKMDVILSPETEEKFLADLASKRIGTDITLEEAGKIKELSDKVASLKNFTNNDERIKYGLAKIDLADYVNKISGKKANFLTNVGGLARAVLTTLDLSAPLNQGFGMATRKEFYKSFKKMFGYFASESKFKALQADIITRPSYKAAKKAGLRLTDLGSDLEKREEVFMTTLLDKIPGIKGSQRAYTGFLNKLRIDIFDDLVKKAEVAGEDVSIGSKALEDIAKTINNFTGGARVGKIEGATPFLNALFFSPRKIASTLNILNPINYVNPNISPTARKAAIRNLVGMLAMSSSIITLGSVLSGEESEKDPRSSDFGKIKVGDLRIDVSGGNATYATLLSRLMSGEMKTKSGVKPLGTGYGQTSQVDLIAQAVRYKLAPNVALGVNLMMGETPIGEKKSSGELIADEFSPMFLSSVNEILNSNAPEDAKAAVIMMSLFGSQVSVRKPQPTKGQIKLKP